MLTLIGQSSTGTPMLTSRTAWSSRSYRVTDTESLSFFNQTSTPSFRSTYKNIHSRMTAVGLRKTFLICLSTVILYIITIDSTLSSSLRCSPSILVTATASYDTVSPIIPSDGSRVDTYPCTCGFKFYKKYTKETCIFRPL